MVHQRKGTANFFYNSSLTFAIHPFGMVSDQTLTISTFLFLLSAKCNTCYMDILYVSVLCRDCIVELFVNIVDSNGDVIFASGYVCVRGKQNLGLKQKFENFERVDGKKDAPSQLKIRITYIVFTRKILHQFLVDIWFRQLADMKLCYVLFQSNAGTLGIALSCELQYSTVIMVGAVPHKKLYYNLWLYQFHSCTQLWWCKILASSCQWSYWVFARVTFLTINLRPLSILWFQLSTYVRLWNVALSLSPVTVWVRISLRRKPVEKLDSVFCSNTLHQTPRCRMEILSVSCWICLVMFAVFWTLLVWVKSFRRVFGLNLSVLQPIWITSTSTIDPIIIHPLSPKHNIHLILLTTHTHT